MTKTTRRLPTRLLWLYQGNHTAHPFICSAAESLAEAGYEVCVLDTAKNRKQGLYQHVTLRAPVVRLLRKLARSMRRKASRDPSSQLPDSLQAYASDRARDSRMPRLLSRLLLQLRHYRRLSWQILGEAEYLLPVLAHAIHLRPIVVVTTYPSISLLGWLAAKLVGARFVYYSFELYSEKSQSMPEFKTIDAFLAKRADALITQNEMRAQIYEQEMGARVKPTIVHNYRRWQAVSRTGRLRRLLGLSNDTRVVLYEGQLLPGRCLDKLVLSAAYFPNDTRLVIMGRRTRWWKQNVEVLLLLRPSLAHKVIMTPWIPHDQLLEYVADTDVGMIIYGKRGRNNYYCEPGKLSDYVIAGVPVVAPSFPTIGPIIEQYRIGELFDSFEPTEIARAINTVLGLPRDCWQVAFEKAQRDLVWETQFPNLLKAVSEKGVAR